MIDVVSFIPAMSCFLQLFRLMIGFGPTLFTVLADHLLCLRNSELPAEGVH